ncbi:hypothetical protein D9M71_251520 [compost metagenome]
MDAQYTRTFRQSQRRERQTTIQPVSHRTIQCLTNHALTRNPDQQGPPQDMQGFHMFEQTQIVLQGFGEAKAGIKNDPLSWNTRQ